MNGGEIFIPKIPSMKIIDLAEAIAPEAKKNIIGIRPGEKIHEVLLTEDEAHHSKEFDNYFILEPEHSFWDTKNFNEGKKLPEGFRYNSEDNKIWLTKDNLEKIMKDI